jgi:hypothetical protein
MAFTIFVWVILFFLSFLKMKSPILVPKTALKRVTLCAGALALMSSLAASYQVFSLWDWETLVTQTGAGLKTRPDPAAPDLSQISEGEKVRILKVLEQDSGQNSWAMVELDSGLRGWIALAHLHLLEKHPVLFKASPSQQIKSFLIFEVVKLEPLKNLN